MADKGELYKGTQFICDVMYSDTVFIPTCPADDFVDLVGEDLTIYLKNGQCLDVEVILYTSSSGSGISFRPRSKPYNCERK